VLAAISMGVPRSVHACAVFHQFEPEDAKRADVVAIAHVARYRLVRGTYFARLDIRIERLLKGRAPDRLSVTWSSVTDRLPWTLASGRYLIGLRAINLPPALRQNRKGKTGLPPAGDELAVLQFPCSSGFLFKEGSAQFKAFPH
jgi:hypothetical protein